MENRSLESILNQNTELISKLDDSTRKISSMEEIIFQISVTEKTKRGKILSFKIIWKRGTLTKVNVRNFNME